MMTDSLQLLTLGIQITHHVQVGALIVWEAASTALIHVIPAVNHCALTAPGLAHLHVVEHGAGA